MTEKRTPYTHELPQWAVERAVEALDEVSWSMEDAATVIARALAEAAKPGWRTDMKNVPFDTTFVVGGWVQDTAGSRWWEEQVVWLDDETGDIAAECECPFSLDDFDHWLPLPAAPEVG